jgi:hypothetical protein
MTDRAMAEAPRAVRSALAAAWEIVAPPAARRNRGGRQTAAKRKRGP